MIPVQRAEMRGAAHLKLSRAAGQHGRTELPIRLETIEGQLGLGNAATLFDLDWLVTEDGKLQLRVYIDGVSFGGALL